MTPDDLLAAANGLMRRPDTLITGIWPRAAALLARQALEAAMAELWASNPQTAEMSRHPMRSQLLCLTAYLDPGMARRTAYLFAALSHACHYHPYELAPTAAELTGWLDQATHLVAQLQAATAAPAQARNTAAARDS